MKIRLLVLVLFGLLCVHASSQGSPSTRSSDKESPLLWMVIRQLDRLETKMTKLQDKNDDTRKQMTRLHAEIKNLKTKIDGEQNMPNKKTKKQMAKDNKLTGTINALEKEITGLLNEMSKIKNTQDIINKDQRAMSTEITKNTKTVKGLQTSNNRLGNLVQSCVKKPIFDVLNVNVRKLGDLVSARGQKINEIKTNMSDLNLLVTRVTKLENAIADLKKICTDIKKGKKADSKSNGVKCKPGWKLYRNHCYYFGHNHVTWDSAKSYCERQSSHLVKIEDSKENTWLGSNIKRFVWIGANDKRKEGSWVWSDQTPLTYSNWKTGEPNDADQRGEDCGNLLKNNNFTWNDWTCSLRTGYICKTP